MELLSTILLYEIDVYQSPKIYKAHYFQKLDIMKKIKLYPKYQPKKVKRIDKINNVFCYKII